MYPQSKGIPNPEPEPETTATETTADVTLPPALAALLATATKGSLSAVSVYYFIAFTRTQISTKISSPV